MKAPKDTVDAFWLRCWRRLLRVLWTRRRSNQSISKEINPEYSLEGLRLKKLKPWFKEPADWKRPWCRGRLKAKGEEGSRGWDGWIALSTQWTWIWANSRRQQKTEEPEVPQLQSPWDLKVSHNLATEQQWYRVSVLSCHWNGLQMLFSPLWLIFAFEALCLMDSIYKECILCLKKFSDKQVGGEQCFGKERDHCCGCCCCC